MDESVYRSRNLGAVVDTTEAAEADRSLLGVSEEAFEDIGQDLVKHPVSTSDRTVGSLRVREIEGIDNIFLLTREDGKLVVTHGGMRKPDGGDTTEDILREAGIVDVLHGASGF